jgi:hypothetical protein
MSRRHVISPPWHGAAIGSPVVLISREVFYRGRLKCPIKIGLGPSRFLGISANCLREQRLASLFQPILDRLTPELCRGTMEIFGNLSEFVVDFLR